MTSPNPEIQRETEAALAARRELGAEFDDHIAAGLAERVEQLAQQRSAQLEQQQGRAQSEAEAERMTRNQRFALGIVSLGAGIPLTAIGANLIEPPLIGVLISWGGIVAVNAIHALGSRRNR